MAAIDQYIERIADENLKTFLHALSAKSKNIFYAVSRQAESWGNIELASTKSSRSPFSSKM